MKNLGYLVAAYSSIWLVISFFLGWLLIKNRKLMKEIDKLRNRIEDLEK